MTACLHALGALGALPLLAVLFAAGVVAGIAWARRVTAVAPESDR